MTHDHLLDQLCGELRHDGWLAVRDLYDGYGLGCRYAPGTLSRALAELVKRGDAVRRWDGNCRFGRYLYRLVPTGA